MRSNLARLVIQLVFAENICHCAVSLQQETRSQYELAQLQPPRRVFLFL
jgi:hypothetical protein